MHARKQQAPDGITSPSLCPVAAPAAGPQFPPSKKRSPQSSKELEYLRSAIRVIPDFPKPGISFKDITPLLRDPVAYNMLIHCMKERVLSILGGVHSMCVFFYRRRYISHDDCHNAFAVLPSSHEAI